MNYKTLHDIRETNKLSLETYSQYIDFHLFDDTVDDIIKKNNEIIKKHEEISSEADSKEKFENFETIFTVSEENLAIIEMKIIYLYKTLEINLKKLLLSAYNLDQVKVKSFFNFEHIIMFLNEKGIEFKKLDHFKEINLLRKMNNHIKHSSQVFTDKDLINCDFFSLNYYTENELNNFYTNIKKSPRNFIEESQNEIYNDLYIFTEDRIDLLSKELVKRMNNSQINDFIKSLQKYQ